jgi:hypothetical protein
VTTKKQKVGVVAEVPIESSSSRSSTARSNSMDLPVANEVLVEVAAMIVALKPSAANLLLSLLAKTRWMWRFHWRIHYVKERLV